MKFNFIFYSVIFAFLVFYIPLVSSAHFIAGFVNNSFDGVSANGYEVVLWKPSIGINDNLTDIIGPNGNSGADNIYFIDCELLNNGCNVGELLNIKVMNNGSNYVSEISSVTVSGAGYDVAGDIRINSPPNMTLNFPINYANLSDPNVLFSCTAGDLDSNLYNVSLYGDWDGEWHLNDTQSVEGNIGNVNFTKTLPEGVYNYSCLAFDNLSVSNQERVNYSFSLDLTPPVISSVYSNLSGDICGEGEMIRVYCNTSDLFSGVENVSIEAIFQSGRSNFSSHSLVAGNYFADIELNETGLWSFQCFSKDYAGNYYNSSILEVVDVHSSISDLYLYYNNISFDELYPIENTYISINASVYNGGCSDADNFYVGFYNGDPLAGGYQIGDNQTISIPSLSTYNINISWSVEIGNNNIFTILDVADVISEYNESNNIANQSIVVGAWQNFYGNISLQKVLADSGIKNLSLWINETGFSGNVFVSDSESIVDWSRLYPIGKNKSGESTDDDFSDIDSLFDMGNFYDSVSNVYTSNGNTPLYTRDFFIHKNNVLDVPIINSSSSQSFYTGILWDGSDDNDGEYDSFEGEDLVFVSEINRSAQGGYGNYDYEFFIPVRLREYDAGDSQNVFIYFDLN